MAFFDTLFGSKQKEPEITVLPAANSAVSPEVIAAISAGVVRAAVMAAVAATVVHVHGGSSVPALRIKRNSGVWVNAGRLQLMGNRQR